MPGAMVSLVAVLSVLSTLTAASPTPVVSNTTLAARANKCPGWIDWFDAPACPDEGNSNGGAVNEMAPGMDITDHDCHPITPGSNFMTIGWCHLFNELTLYSDADCKNNVSTIKQRTEPKKLTEDCADLSQIKVLALKDTSAVPL